MLQRLLLAAALTVGLASPTLAQSVQILPGCGSASPQQGPGSSEYAGPTGSRCVDTTVQGAAAYRGGTIAAGGASQQLLAANPARRGFTVQNQSTGDLFIKVGQTATTSNVSFRIAAGAYYETQPQHVSTGVVNIIGATTGQAFYATEY